VSHDFTQALKHLPTQSVVACSARSLDDARKFADKHGIRNSYGSYDEMVRDEDVEIVYVGNLHAFRRETVEKCLAANKHVLVEKPFACNVVDGEYLLGLAKERDRFIMEGMWTRFFPAVEKARELMFGTATMEPALGEIAKVYSDFNFYAPDQEAYPTSFFYDRKLGGGAAFVVAPYPIAAATLCFRNPPDSVEVVGQKDEGTGVDIQGAMILSFPPTGNEHDGRSPKLPG
jgi:dihydrodiol dehydrogenase / D-xylose 1-dehydrogenase (NADP)